MQPDIPALDRFLIRLATRRGLRVATWLLAGLVLLAARSWYLLWVAALVPLAHLYGIWVLKQYHPLLVERLAEAIEADGRAQCELEEADEAYLVTQTTGQVGGGPLAALPDTMSATLMALMDDCAVFTRHTGTIFPPRWLHPLEFRHRCEGQTEIYYSDVNYVEGDSERLVLHFSSGSTFEVGGNGSSREAVAAMRAKLRAHKSPGARARLNSDPE